MSTINPVRMDGGGGWRGMEGGGGGGSQSTGEVKSQLITISVMGTK